MTFKTITLFIFFSGNLIANSSIKEQLENLDGIVVSEIKTEDNFSECFKILVKQPINHSDSTKGYFYQKVYLSHKSTERPVVMKINGYISYSNQISEWTKVLDANQIYIEHRYFGESTPDTLDYKYLNLSNAAKDFHRIRELFSQIYKNGWVSLGHSKGGLTALSYRYFFPDDVDATIALSTSVKTSKCDSSFFNYIDSLNYAQGCKEALETFQETLLTHKEEILPHLENYLLNNGKQYSRLGLIAIYEIAVLEIPFAIWQNRNGCSSIKLSQTDSKGLFVAMKASLHGWFMSDDVFKSLVSYHYQAMTELGFYCYPLKRYSELLETDFDKLTPVQPVLGIETTYSNLLMTELKEWAETSGNQILYVSGGNDPYSKYKITPDNNLGSKSVLLKGYNHNQVFINFLDSQTRDEVTDLVNKWITQ